jgi:hypothetical protein
MKLYHGTTGAVARRALTEGLSPRSETGVSGNWKDHPSWPSRVYLTTTYAPYFAGMAQAEGAKLPEQSWGIVEVESDRIDQALVPDEDWLEQGTRGAIPRSHVLLELGLHRARSVKARTQLLARHAGVFRDVWLKSLDGLGTCAHEGSIQARAVTRVAIYDPTTNPFITCSALDPTISLANHRFCSQRYKALTRWFFEPVTVVEFDDPFALVMPDRAAQLAAALDARHGLTVLTNSLPVGSERRVA